MEIISAIIVFLVIVAFFGIYVASAVWAVNDAQRRGQGGGIIILLIWIFGPLAAIIWRFVRPSSKLADSVPEDYDNPEDEIAAASRLEMLGEWDAATAFYQNAAMRWQEHERYAQECMRRIQTKQSQT